MGMSEVRRTVAATAALAPEFVGLTESDAEALAARRQVVLRWVRMKPPGEKASYAVSADLVSNRLTLWLQSGKVLKAEAG
ncbi:MAG: hypothetical protein JWL79_2112 [Frankiales bacterium]|nr:hypothetical protein [Frankiales bacterium]